MISTYTQASPVVFGVDAINQIAEKAKDLGGSRALCIYDQGVKITGMADRIIKLLNDAGIETVVYEGVKPDPTNDAVDTAGQFARDSHVDIIIGIGGGSTLDTAKCVAVLNDNPLPITQYWASLGKKYEMKTPLILVPTSSGTGSEVTMIAAIVDLKTHIKEAVVKPGNLAIVDPALTLTVPPHITAVTGMDALSHAVESYTTNCTNPRSDVLALEAIKLIAQNLEKATCNGSDLEARTQLSLASNFAGISFGDASVHFGHALGHEFGGVFHLPHGAACALTIPEVIVFAADIIPERIINIGKAFGLDFPANTTGLQAAELTAEKVRNLLKAVGIMSLKQLGISRADAVACAKGAVENNWFVSCAVKEVNVDVMAELIEKIYDNFQ
ncbi:iron-containing alcohol dehydrogenase [Acetobacterium tundrae]|uniref:Iron-containing alcohol dehydrogenase n=1 Tax=Acetobacterium tundrae TaxID=132932 RepID=A0ABR6WLZ7_9FIRM|nr:iron-containing alcohol dehydrogenase [Acetobacterium tundrae]MBC3797495.1 iron-containing alcohol dehydrogenase [Acetobacterium tundrae]